MYKKIIPVFVSIAMLWGLFSFSVAATGVERSQTTTGFGSYLLNLFTSWQKENPDAPPSEYDGFGRGGGFENSYMGNWHSDTAACPSSEAPGGYHYIDPDVPSRMSGFGSEGTNWEFCCLYCHEYFTVTGDSLSEAYKDYVADFPASSVDSKGYLYWIPSFDYGKIINTAPVKNIYFYWGNTTKESTYLLDNFTVVSEYNPVIFTSLVEGSGSGSIFGSVQLYTSGFAPVSGYYYKSGLSLSGYYLLDGERFTLSSNYTKEQSYFYSQRCAGRHPAVVHCRWSDGRNLTAVRSRPH